MKYSLLSIFTIGFAMHAFAQQETGWTPVIEKAKTYPRINSTAKTTSLTERLSAIATYKPNGAASTWLTDSAMYRYYGIRGSRFDFNAMRYNDTSNMTDLLFDTAMYYKNVNGNVVNTTRVGGTYTASNQLLNQLSQVPAGNFFQHVHSDSFFYNANHTLARQRHYTWITNLAFDTVSEQLYAYNTLGQLTQDVSYIYAGNYTFNPTGRNDYKYTGAGKQDTVVNFVYTANTWKTNSRIFFDYYPGDLLRAYTIQNYNGSAWINSVRDSFGYGMFNIYNYYQRQTWNGTQWVNVVKDVRHANAQGVADTQRVSYWNTTTQAYYAPTVTAWVYDSLFRPTRSVKYDSAGNFADSMKYYYETYNSPVSVPVVSSANAVVYPNPANDVLFIKWDDATVAQLSIINAQGQQVRNIYTDSNAEITIQLSSLAPGMYWIRGVNKDGIQNFHASFVKE